MQNTQMTVFFLKKLFGFFRPWEISLKNLRQKISSSASHCTTCYNLFLYKSLDLVFFLEPFRSVFDLLPERDRFSNEKRLDFHEHVYLSISEFWYLIFQFSVSLFLTPNFFGSA